MIRKVAILAAGEGMRLRPITSVVPKEMLPIIDTPVIQYVLEETLIPGIEELILVTNRKKTALTDYLTTAVPDALRKLLNGVSLRIVYQEDKTSAYGSGAGLLSAAEYLQGEPFILVFADSFTLPREERIKKMTEAFETKSAPIVSLISIQREQFQTYGIPRIAGEEDGLLLISEILEKPASASGLQPIAAPGGWILKPDIFDYLNMVDRDSRTGEVFFTPALNAYCKEHKVYGQLFTGAFFEMGNRDDFAKSLRAISLLQRDM